MLFGLIIIVIVDFESDICIFKGLDCLYICLDN